MRFLLPLLLALSAAASPIRVLFLGHDSQHHNSNAYYPLLAKALGQEAIYFDYVTTVEAAFGDADYLNRFDVVLLYANHGNISKPQWQNLKAFVEGGKGFVPVHCASWCFGNEPEFDQLVGGRFKSHQGAVFSPRVVDGDHVTMVALPLLKAWDETYFHSNHNPQNRTVLQVRDAMQGDPHTDPEPWTWTRTQGKGRVFYTASGHDERVWKDAAFHALLKRGILWAAGDARKVEYEAFVAARAPRKSEVRDNIPNYERRPKPLEYQLPMSPQDSMAYTQVPVGFRLELFASEPDIVNPISMAWDERGRLWVAETIDYPNTVNDNREGRDRIKILEDTNGDGKCDTVKVFADGLNVITSIVFARGGVIAAVAPHFYFLQDTDGDDKADVKEILCSGWGVGDTHAGPSNLRYGIDNWIWGAVGYSRFNGEIGDENHNFGSGLFRIRSDASAIEFRHQFNNNTWGLGFNAAGDAFGSTANNNPSFFGGIPAANFANQRGKSAKMIADTRLFHPITPNVRQVDAFNNYTAAAGHALATSDALPENYRDRMAFVCGPTGHLLGQYELRRDGSGYAARNRGALIASADEWFSPVAAEVGPDGHLWIADWYNFIIQHNPTPNKNRGGYDATRGKGNAHENPNRDYQHGRIYRLIWEGAPAAPRRNLAGATNAALVAALADSNMFWRLTAQRLLVDEKRTSTIPALQATLRGGGIAASHALWTLRALDHLDRESLLFALMHADSALRRNAVRALSATSASQQLLFDSGVLADKDLLTRLAAFNKLAEFPEEVVAIAAKGLSADPVNTKDEWLSAALTALGGNARAAKGKPVYGANILPNSSFEEGEAMPTGWKVRNYRGQSAHARVSDKARTGTHSLRISSEKSSDTSAYASVTLTPNTDYRLSAWILTENVKGAHGALMNVHEMQHEAKTNALKGGRGKWRQVTKTFNSSGRRQVTVNCLLGGWGTSTGTAWWDDVALEPITYVVEAKPKDELQAGDVDRGKTLFHEHEIASCIRCHKLGDAGGVIGPALDGIAARKQRDYLLEALVKPNATIAEGYQSTVSPMPPMNILLTPQELADVLAYLLTLD